MTYLQPQNMFICAPNAAYAFAITGVTLVQPDCGASATIMGTESVVAQVEGSKDRGKAHDWAEGAEGEAGEWAGTPDPAGVDAWHREASPEASRPAPDAAQAPGDVPPPGDCLTLPCNGR